MTTALTLAGFALILAACDHWVSPSTPTDGDCPDVDPINGTKP